MSIGIQKLNGNSGPADVLYPRYLTSGMDKPVNQIARMQLAAWPDSTGSLNRGPGITGTSLVNGANNRFTGRWGGIVVTMWIRTASNRGGPILAFGVAITGTDSGPQAQGTDSIDFSVGADGVSFGGSEWTFNLNEFNTGWHFIQMSCGNPNELYVDGRFKTPTNSGSTGSFSSGFDAMFIGGRVVNFKQGVTDYTKNINFTGGTQQFDIAQLAVYEQGANLYPFYDLGAQASSGDQFLLNAGKAPGTFTAPASNTLGNAHPFPIIYIPFDQNNFNAVGGWGNATTDAVWYEPGDLNAHPNGVVPTYGGSLEWFDITGKTSGVIGNGPFPSGTRLPPERLPPYGSPAQFTYNANRDLYYALPINGSINFWSYDDLDQDWEVSSSITLPDGGGTNQMTITRDHDAGEFTFVMTNQGGSGVPNNGHSYTFSHTPAAGWNHYSFLRGPADIQPDLTRLALYVNGVLVSQQNSQTSSGRFTQFTVGEEIEFDGVSFQQLYIKLGGGRIDFGGRYVDLGPTAITDSQPNTDAATDDLYERFTPTLTNLVEPNATAGLT